MTAPVAASGPRSFADIVAALDAANPKRMPGVHGPSVHGVWEASCPEDRRIIEAIIAVELTYGQQKRMTVKGETVVRARLKAMDDAAATVRERRLAAEAATPPAKTEDVA